jgi:hypothetical protein
MAARVTAAQELLARKLAELRSGEDWKRYLTFQARLHHYSPNNATLIYLQHVQAYSTGLTPEPKPSYVAGYATWKTLGRTVERGQHGYAILAPLSTVHRTAIDPQGVGRILMPGEPPELHETESAKRTLRGFKIEYVFDISQTRGRPIPRPIVTRLLVGEAPKGLSESVLGIVQSRGYRVDTVPSAAQLDGANGVTNWTSRTIIIRRDMDAAAMVKTLVHEAAHVLLHEQPPGQYLPRQLKEVEAESVAYLVTSAHGMASEKLLVPLHSDLGRGEPRRGLAPHPDAGGSRSQGDHRLQLRTAPQRRTPTPRRRHPPDRTIGGPLPHCSDDRTVKAAALRGSVHLTVFVA